MLPRLAAWWLGPVSATSHPALPPRIFYAVCPRLVSVHRMGLGVLNVNGVFMSSDLELFMVGGGVGPWADLGATDRQKEGTYRRGYHQAMAEVMVILRSGKTLTPEILAEWVEGDGMKWRFDTPLDRHILAPALIKPIA